MEQRRFDALAKAFARPESRRRYLLGLLGVAVGGVGIVRGGLAKQGACRGLGDGCTMFTGCCSGLTCVVSGLNPNTGFCESGGTGSVAIEQPAGEAPSSASLTTAAQTPKSVRQKAQKATQEAKDDRKQSTKTARKRREKATQTARDRRINATQTARERKQRRIAKTREAKNLATQTVDRIRRGLDIELTVNIGCSSTENASFIQVLNSGKKSAEILYLQTLVNPSYTGTRSQDRTTLPENYRLAPDDEITFRPRNATFAQGETPGPVFLEEPFFLSDDKGIVNGEGAAVYYTNDTGIPFNVVKRC